MNFKEEVIRSQKDLNLIYRSKRELRVKAKYGPSKVTKIPLKIKEELAFLTATIIGDGHLKKSKFQISFECTNLSLVKLIRNICQEIFERQFNISKPRTRKNRKPTFIILLDSKAIYNLLKEVLEIPSGKKSSIVKIPKYIFNSNSSIKSAFLTGIMATEGGKRRRGFGLSTASPRLWEDLILLLKEQGIKISVDRWIYKKYNKEYYGIHFKKDNLHLITKNCKNSKIKNMLSKLDNLKI